jgi:hypothetical protein
LAPEMGLFRLFLGKSLASTGGRWYSEEVAELRVLWCCVPGWLAIRLLRVLIMNRTLFKEW